jgi:hypothetical protein
LFSVEPAVLTTFITPPYERKDEQLIQYSYWESVESGLPKTLIKSCSVDISIGKSTGPIGKGPAITPMLSKTLSALPIVKSTSLTSTPGDN